MDMIHICQLKFELIKKGSQMSTYLEYNLGINCYFSVTKVLPNPIWAIATFLAE